MTSKLPGRLRTIRRVAGDPLMYRSRARAVAAAKKTRQMLKKGRWTISIVGHYSYVPMKLVGYTWRLHSGPNDCDHYCIDRVVSKSNGDKLRLTLGMNEKRFSSNPDRLLQLISERMLSRVHDAEKNLFEAAQELKMSQLPNRQYQKGKKAHGN